MTRREMLRWLGVSGTLAAAGNAFAASSPRDDSTVSLPPQEIPVLHKTQVLVVGGGSAGVCAAIGAARAGAKTILVERYGQLGGLWTSGLVLPVIGTRSNRKMVVRGIGGEILDQLKVMEKGVIGYESNVPIVDPEATKWVMMFLLEEAGVKLLYHSWCADAVMDGATIQGAIFESKQGRFSILADAVVDASGDGDVFAFAGASHSTHKTTIGGPFRGIGIGKQDRKTIKAELDKELGKNQVYTNSTPLPNVTQHNQIGKSGSGLLLEDLTQAECSLRRLAWKAVDVIRRQPGCDRFELLELAPMLGVRGARNVEGLHKLSPQDMKAKEPRSDAIGISPVPNAAGLPYGIVVPKDVNNLTVGGRCVSAESGPAGTLRLVPYCFLTGHAAGVGAALAAQQHTSPGKVDVAEVRKVLRQQGAFLG